MGGLLGDIIRWDSLGISGASNGHVKQGVFQKNKYPSSSFSTTL
jgi:hypothetical protein